MTSKLLYQSWYQKEAQLIYFAIFLDSLALMRSAFLVLITPLLAALSTAEKALLKESSVNNSRKLSIAVLALVLVALLYVALRLSDRCFLIADLVNGISTCDFTTRGLARQQAR